MHPCCAALLGSQLSRPAAALLDEAACLLAANDTAALLTRRSACANFNATLSATDGVALMCPAACRRKLQQVCSMAYPKEEGLTSARWSAAFTATWGHESPVEWLRQLSNDVRAGRCVV